MNFGQALELLKGGKQVARAGWGGKGMFIYLARYPDGRLAGVIDVPGNITEVNGTRPCIVMYDEQKSIAPGWLASQADMLAEDWREVGS